MSVTLKPRPLSPHLQVYRPQLTSMLSVLHRGTGIFLSLGTVAIVCWLSALASGAAAYEQFQSVVSHPFSQLVLFGWCFSMCYHLCNGIRHLFWDIGAGLEISTVYRTGTVVLLVSCILTAVITYCALSSIGGVA